MNNAGKSRFKAQALACAVLLSQCAGAAAEESAYSIRVACVQMAVKPDLKRNLREIVKWIEKASQESARVVVFPECALTGFDKSYVLSLSWKQIEEAQEVIAEEAHRKDLYVIYGTVTDSGRSRPFNTAVVVGPDGKEIHRYHKMLPESWFEPGRGPGFFKIDGVPCTIIICHDQRYPELVRIPVLAGARICFSPAFEVNSLQGCLRKVYSYRCQVVARAVENTIWFVESNAYGPCGKDPRILSLGDSCIIDPGGNVVAQAQPLKDWLGVYDLDIRRATRANAVRSLRDSALAPWWRLAVARLEARCAVELQTPRKALRGKKLRIGMMHGGIPKKWDLKANFAVFEKLVEEAAGRKVQLFVTPECWLDGYAASDPASTRERLKREAAQRLDESPYIRKVASKAARYHMYILFCFTLRTGEKLYNTAALWDDRGRLVGLYHKTHLQGHDLQFDPGPSLPVFPSPWGPIGVMICADRRWPEVPRVLRLKGAKLILNPSYGMHHEANRMWMQTRGYENQCFIAFTHPVQSLLIGPKGEVIEKVDSTRPGVLVREIDLLRAKDDNHLRDRRPELYRIICR